MQALQLTSPDLELSALRDIKALLLHVPITLPAHSPKDRPPLQIVQRRQLHTLPPILVNQTSSPSNIVLRQTVVVLFAHTISLLHTAFASHFPDRHVSCCACGDCVMINYIRLLLLDWSSSTDASRCLASEYKGKESARCWNTKRLTVICYQCL